MELDKMYYAPLADRKLINISGDDAAVFLQGLVSNDVTRLKKGEAVYAALLSPQGKFLHDFFLLPWNDTILIDCNAESLADLMSRLTMYKLRSKVVIEAKDDTGIAAIWGTGAKIQEPGIWIDPRLAQLGWRMAGNKESIRSWCEQQKMQAADANAYERLRLSFGVPDGTRDMVRDRSLLLEFGFEDLHGVDFSKGCYVGQEVTARSKYRGQVRKFIYHVQAAENLPPCGTPVTLEGAPAGELRSSAGSTGIALLNVAMVEKAHAAGQNLYAGTVAFKATLPLWVTHPPKALTLGE